MSQQYICDRIELQDLMLNYAAGVDERDRSRYVACFADDVEAVNFGTRIYRNRDTFVDYVWSALEKYSSSQHLLGPQFATIDGDCATTRSDVQALHFFTSGEGRFTLWGTYHTNMRRFEGRWLISRHELRVCGTATV